MPKGILYVGSTPTFKATFKDSETELPKNIVGANVRFKFKIGSNPVEDSAATITDGPNGKAEFKVPAAKILQGLMQYWWKLTDTSSNVHFQNEHPFEMTVINEPA